MAKAYFTSPSTILHKSCPVVRPGNKLAMLKHFHLPARRTQAFQIRSSSNNMVFEDKSEGIICYRDENGEIICEGYDEGPRFHQKTANNCGGISRDSEIIDLLQQNWIQIIKGSEVYQADAVVAVQEEFDINSNGFSSFC